MAVKRYAVCLHTDFGPEFSGDDLLPGQTYEVLGMERGLLRVVDESGEDYLYPVAAFRELDEADNLVLAASLARLAA